MNLLQAAILDRLWSKYERRFGHQPPITSASLDEAIDLLRRQLAAGDDDALHMPSPGAIQRAMRKSGPGGGGQARAA